MMSNSLCTDGSMMGPWSLPECSEKIIKVSCWTLVGFPCGEACFLKFYSFNVKFSSVYSGMGTL